MAYDWSGLLAEVEAYALRRKETLSCDDREGCRRQTPGALFSSPTKPPLFEPVGLARKVNIPASDGSPAELTIGDVLKPAVCTPKAIIALHGRIAAEQLPEEEWRRSGGGGGGYSPGSRSPKGQGPGIAVEHANRAAIAAGAQPVVIKVASTISSRASAGGLLTYLGTREGEKDGEKGRIDIPIHDQDGFAILTRDERSAVLAEWGEGFRDAYAVDSVATVSITLQEGAGDAELHAGLAAAFGSKAFLYAREDNRIAVYAATDIAAKKLASALKAREKSIGSAKFAENVEGRLGRILETAGIHAEVRIEGAAVSEAAGRYFLAKFLRSHANIRTSADGVLKKAGPVKESADQIWREWSQHIRKVEPRNAFHVIFSARAGTNPETMTRAVRDFLSEQVAGHRWITAHHPETGHVHVHAMISARDDVGKPLRFTKPELYEWRERFAAKARDHGIAMVATRRADLAATRPYSQKQAGAYERGKSDPRYVKNAAIRIRVENKRAGTIDRLSLADKNLALAPKWKAASNLLKKIGADPSAIAASNRFAGLAEQSAMEPSAAASLKALISSKVQEKTTPLSVKQFDERVLRANKAMDRLEAMADSGAERQAVQEMRRAIATLFAEQRRDIEGRQVRPEAEAVEGGVNTPAARLGLAAHECPNSPSVDPAIAAQQRAIAEGRTARTAREQAEMTKARLDEQRQKTLREAAQERRREHGRDGAER